VPNPCARQSEQRKANLDHDYDLPDSRWYFETLGSLGY
jgi:hypothetical protein